MKKHKLQINNMEFFRNSLGDELKRFDANGNQMENKKAGGLLTVTCIEENIDNLYNSQFEDKTVYGQVFYYSK